MLLGLCWLCRLVHLDGDGRWPGRLVRHELELIKVEIESFTGQPARLVCLRLAG
jgi:hypothetical protein